MLFFIFLTLFKYSLTVNCNTLAPIFLKRKIYCKMRNLLTPMFSLLLYVCTFVPSTTLAQGFINFSKTAGTTANELVNKMEVVNGETYVLGYTSSPNFPITNGSTYKGKNDMTLTKYDVAGNVMYATYIGGFGDDYLYLMKVVNGEVYLAGTTDSSGYVVTNSSVYTGERDIIVTKITANGSIGFSTYIGGSAYDYLSSSDLIVEGNEILLSGITFSPNFPRTMGNGLNGDCDIFLTKLNATNGAIVQSKLFGGSGSEYSRQILYEGGYIYLTNISSSIDFPITFGTPPNINSSHLCILKLNSNNFSTIYSRYLSGTNGDEWSVGRSKVLNGQLHVTGYTSATDFPTTNGTVVNGSANYPYEAFYTKLNTNGSIAFCTMLEGDGFHIPYDVKLVGSDVYILCQELNLDFSRYNINVFKINGAGGFTYAKKLNIFNGNSLGTNGYISLEVVGNDAYVAGITSSQEYPVTNPSQFYAEGTGVFTKLDSAGNIVHSSYLGKMSSINQIQYANNKFYLIGGSNLASYPTTDSSTITGGIDNLLIILKPDGTSTYSGYVGGTANENSIYTGLKVSNQDVFFTGQTNSTNYPVTSNILNQGENDQFITKLSFCANKYNLNNDTLSPKIQTVCRFGLANKIVGRKLEVPADSLPIIYRNGIATPQKPLPATYQWQIATSLSGPWANIANATFKDYTPIVGGVNQYYRRLAFTQKECGATQIHISDTASALINTLTAPTLNLNGPYNTCPNTAITIGGTPAATGGNPPYISYAWDNGISQVANPSVSPADNTIYSLIVTDSLGCKQIGQALVLVHRANAGIDQKNCSGNAVRIGTPAIVGVPGITYNWLPTAGLSNAAVAQPFASTVSVTNYTLTVTVPKTGGGTCLSTDSVQVAIVLPPTTLDIAGPDKVICLKERATIGTPAEATFNYVWSPGSYMSNNISASTEYYPGNLFMPVPNPAILKLTALKDGCAFADQMEMATIESRAGLDGCGPRIVGLGDRTPNINETYLWTKISGPGNFTGATNLPQVPVSESVGGVTVYGLLVTYKTGSCYSEVKVPPCGGSGCGILILAEAAYKCPSYAVNFGNVTLTAFSSITDAVYTWSPQAGLDNYNTNRVKLTDNVTRTYTVTATNINNPAEFCSDTISVNSPAFSRPVFNAPDVLGCANQPIQIGAATVAGYQYQWTGFGYLSNESIGNPIANVPTDFSFPVLVTDGNGCELKDTVKVTVQSIKVDAGLDWLICSNAIAKLGTPAIPLATYLWEPQASPWQNGTNQFSAQPEVLLATDATFIVTATTSVGCISKDTVNVVINNSPTIPDAPDRFLCAGSSIQIGSPALPGVTYQWNPNTGLDNPSAAQPFASATSATNITYTLTATFPGACALISSDQVNVRVSNPTFNMPDITYCPSNGPVALGAAAPANMNSYIWYPTDQVSNYTIANPTSLNPPPSTAASYVLYVTNSDGCQAQDSITITPIVTKPLAGADKTICVNNSTVIGSTTNDTGVGIVYSWSPSNFLSNSNSPNPTFNGSTIGMYTYILSKTIGGCTAKDTVEIKVADLAIANIYSPTVCQNSCVQIGIAPTTGISYQWIPTAGLSNSNISNPLACVTTLPATYTLTATDANGCTANKTVTIGVKALPAAQIIIPTVTACLGDTTAQFNPIINPTGAYNYLWNPNDASLSNINIINPIINAGNTGIKQYNLLVTDTITGCSNSGNGTAIINQCPLVANLGDFMWFDTNNDGIQNNGELGVSNITIKLFNSADFNVATTTTNAAGLYSFSNITPGNGYYVIFSKPTGYSFTTQTVGGATATNNSKTDASGRTISFNITNGASILNIDAGITPTGATPVTLLSFTARLLQNKNVALNWQTTAELNNKHFVVQRSIDGINFINIGIVNGHGTSNLPHSYALVDVQPFYGINYYRLQQIDYDGNPTFSSIVQVRLMVENLMTANYNQSSNCINISFSKIQGATNFKLFADNGQLIKMGNITNIINYSIHVPRLASGVYLLQVSNEKIGVTISRILIN